jgi:hypothetical protein
VKGRRPRPLDDGGLPYRGYRRAGLGGHAWGNPRSCTRAGFSQELFCLRQPIQWVYSRLLTTRILTDFAAIGTFLGVVFAAWQLLLTRQQAKTEFEDRVTELYRTLAASLPVEVFFDEPVDQAIVESHRSVFYRYFDLCNEQAFLHEQHRISDATWKQWRDGMAGNMRCSLVELLTD